MSTKEELLAAAERGKAYWVNEDEVFTDDTLGSAVKKNATVVHEAIVAEMSPPGELDIPLLLEEARWKYLMPDFHFDTFPAFDRVYVYQIPPLSTERGMFGKGSLIALPETSKAREKAECPQGIILCAGLSALDSLRSHGMDIGHHVDFLRNLPYRKRVGIIAGREFHVLVMRVGDISGSRTLQDEVRRNAKSLKRDLDGYHRFEDGGEAVKPIEPYRNHDN